MITELDERSSLRHGLNTRRYHAWRMLQEQRVDGHTAQMLGIYICCWGLPPREVTAAILFHDAGEGDAGDIQYGAKRRYPKLKEGSDECEADTVHMIIDTDVLPEHRENVRAALEALPGREWMRMKACDLVDGLEHATMDVCMGNSIAIPVVDAYRSGLDVHLGRMEFDDRRLVLDYLARHWAKKQRRYVEKVRALYEVL